MRFSLMFLEPEIQDSIWALAKGSAELCFFQEAIRRSILCPSQLLVAATAWTYHSISASWITLRFFVCGSFCFPLIRIHLIVLVVVSINFTLIRLEVIYKAKLSLFFAAYLFLTWVGFYFTFSLFFINLMLGGRGMLLFNRTKYDGTNLS